MAKLLEINFKPTDPLISRDPKWRGLRDLSDSQLNSIVEPTGLTILKKYSFSSYYDLYLLSDKKSVLVVFSSRIVLGGPIDLLAPIEPILKLTESFSLKASSVNFFPFKSIFDNTQPEFHHRSFDQVIVLNDLFGHLKAQVRHESYGDFYSASEVGDGGVEAPHLVIGSGGFEVKVATEVIYSGMKDSLEPYNVNDFDFEINENPKGLNNMKAFNVQNHAFNVQNHDIAGRFSGKDSFGGNRQLCYLDYDGTLSPIEYVDADDDGYMLAGFGVIGNVNCADNGAFRNTETRIVGMNNGYGGGIFHVNGINSGQNGHPFYSGNGNGRGGNVPNGGSDVPHDVDFDNYISIMLRSNASNGEPSLTFVGHVVLQNGDGFPSFIRKVHLEWARYENQMPHEDGEIDASTAWPGYKIQYIGTVEGFETDGMVELEVPGWSWEVFAERLEEIIVEREDDNAEENAEDEEA